MRLEQPATKLEQTARSVRGARYEFPAQARLMAQNKARLNFHSFLRRSSRIHVSNANDSVSRAMSSRSGQRQFQKYRDRAARVNAFHGSRAFRRFTCTQKTTLLFHIAVQ
jgi:hypothetical protein